MKPLCTCGPVTRSHRASCPCWGTGAPTSHQTDVARLRAEVRRLRAALQRIEDPKNWGEDGGWCGKSYPDEIARAAIAPRRGRKIHHKEKS